MSAILFRADHRDSLRRQARIPCQIVAEQDFRLVADQVLDLSLTGMQVAALRYAREHTRVLVSFRIPDSSVWLDTEGVLSRIAWGRRLEDRTPAYGVRFLSLPRMEAAVLTARLRHLPRPAPRRRVRIDYAETVRRIAQAA